MLTDRWGNPTLLGLALYVFGVALFYLIVIAAVVYMAASIVKSVFGL